LAGYDTPIQPIPEPLRGAEEGTFTHYTITVRFKNTIGQVLKDNQFPPEVVSKLQELKAGIPDVPIRALQDSNAPDSGDWLEYSAPYRDIAADDSPWLHAPWFFVETYFYRRILEVTGYFQAGPGFQKDPYIHQKRQGLEEGQESIRSTARKLSRWLANHDRDNQGVLKSLLEMAVWGNQADLSMWPAGGKEAAPNHQESQQQAHLLVDQTKALGDYLSTLQPRVVRIDILVDNAGLELAQDLFLVDFLLSSKMAQLVHLHHKPHPTFVSDAMIKDVQETIASFIENQDPDVRAFGQRLQSHLDTQRLRLIEHYFWTSPLSGWEMPPELKAELKKSDLIISKGDANYRRLLGDRHWPYTTPLEKILRYMPAPLAALRVLKSEVAAGHPAGQPEEIAKKDSDWLTDGKWAVIQFVKPQFQQL
jgi:uncharacterized protein with ATP-grasp and redox domains